MWWCGQSYLCAPKARLSKRLGGHGPVWLGHVPDDQGRPTFVELSPGQRLNAPLGWSGGRVRQPHSTGPCRQGEHHQHQGRESDQVGRVESAERNEEEAELGKSLKAIQDDEEGIFNELDIGFRISSLWRLSQPRSASWGSDSTLVLEPPAKCGELPSPAGLLANPEAGQGAVLARTGEGHAPC